ncbi:MAG: cytochrome c [Acidimicrobiia bacterium]|nr:cytochrome c [Acidimicrobiia bacterium]
MRYRLTVVLGIAFVVATLLGNTAAAQETETPDEETIAQLQDGADVYSAVCAGCHQQGGTGIEGTFPPLRGNTAVEDAEYVAQVIANGREGRIEVNGVEYDGAMPAFSTLSTDEVTAVIAYIQNDFVVPGGGPFEAPSTLPVAGTQLPELTGMAIVAAFMLAAAVIVFVLAPRIIGATDRVTLPWLDAWLKTALIVGFFIIGTVFVPSLVIQSDIVTDLPRELQDIIGSGLWGGALLIGLAGLWWFHRENRI